MDLDPTDEQQSIVDVFGSLAERTVPLDRLRDHEPLGFAPALWEQLVAVGAPGMAFCRISTRPATCPATRRDASNRFDP